MEESENIVQNEMEIVSDSSIENSPLKEVTSPSKKRRKIDSPSKFNRSQLDDGSMCNICFDCFNTSGEHRIVSLKCGHFFGNSCISKWVKENKNCPQCKCVSSVREFRNIFATKILVVDNTREMELEIEIQQLTREKNEAAAMNNQNVTTIALQRRQIREMEAQIQALKSLIVSNKNSPTLTCIQTIKGGKMYLEKNIDFKDGSECKLINFMGRSKKILITQKTSGTSLFSGYGVRFLDAAQQKCEKFINMNNKPIIDFSFDPSETYVMSTSKENACKVYSVSTCQSIASFSPSAAPIWSCAFNKVRDHQVIFGTQSGTVFIYDIKKANEVLHVIENLEKSPAKFVVPMNKSDSFPGGGFFVVQVRGLYFYEYTAASGLTQTKLNFDDSIFTATYDDKTEMLLITTAGMEQTFHILTRLVKVEDIPVLQEIYRIPSSHTSGIPKFTRPCQIKVPDGFIVACYKDETKELEIHTPSVGKLHSFMMQNVISDICPIYMENSSVSFTALASTKCRIYKVNLEYR